MSRAPGAAAPLPARDTRIDAIALLSSRTPRGDLGRSLRLDWGWIGHAETQSSPNQPLLARYEPVPPTCLVLTYFYFYFEGPYVLL